MRFVIWWTRRVPALLLVVPLATASVGSGCECSDDHSSATVAHPSRAEPGSDAEEGAEGDPTVDTQAAGADGLDTDSVSDHDGREPGELEGACYRGDMEACDQLGH